MKELSIEEKAKAYDEALKVAVAAHKDEDKHLKATLERIFPELKEGEDERKDERIRKVLIDYFNRYKEHEECGVKTFYGIPTDDILTWLEKQDVQKSAEWHKGDEQNLNACLGYIPDEYLRRWLMDVIHVKYDKPTDKVEVKFKVGDWVVIKANGNEHVKQIVRIEYFASGHPQYIFSDGLWFGNGTEARLWTIQDAKNGDVLVASDGSIFLFRGVDDSACKYYAALTADNYIKINKEAKGGYWETSRAVYPATKEQCNLLFAKMKEVGYDWDAEKKEPKKIEQMSSWSEEDKNFMYDTLSNLTELKDRYGEGYGNVGKCIGWLKTLKQRCTWKPSDEQLDALQYVYRNIIPPLSDELGWNSLKTLELMYHDLKKLRKE